MTIFENQHEYELESYTRALLRKISEKTKIQLEELFDYIYDHEEHSMPVMPVTHSTQTTVTTVTTVQCNKKPKQKAKTKTLIVTDMQEVSASNACTSASKGDNSLEYICISGSEFFMNPDTKELYLYNDPETLVAKLNKYNEPELIKRFAIS